ncbi:MAG: hypothetical protein ACYCU8_05895 [Ferrimicrobium acidiphilum]
MDDLAGAITVALDRYGWPEAVGGVKQFCQSMIWGATPSFDDVAGTFTNLARGALGGQGDDDNDDQAQPLSRRTFRLS